MSEAKVKMALRRRNAEVLLVLVNTKRTSKTQTQTQTQQLNSVTANQSNNLSSEAEAIVQEYADVFADLPKGLPPKRSIDHRIETIPGSSPPNKAPYRLNLEEMKELKATNSRIN